RISRFIGAKFRIWYACFSGYKNSIGPFARVWFHRFRYEPASWEKAFETGISNMSTADTQTRYSPEDLLRMPDGDRFELVDGQLVELHVSTWSSYVAGRVYRLVANHTESNRLGWPLPENTSYQGCSRYPTKVRRPDLSF